MVSFYKTAAEVQFLFPDNLCDKNRNNILPLKHANLFCLIAVSNNERGQSLQIISKDVARTYLYLFINLSSVFETIWWHHREKRPKREIQYWYKSAVKKWKDHYNDVCTVPKKWAKEVVSCVARNFIFKPCLNIKSNHFPNSRRLLDQSDNFFETLDAMNVQAGKYYDCLLQYNSRINDFCLFPPLLWIVADCRKFPFCSFTFPCIMT